MLGGVLFPEVVSAGRTCCARLSEPVSLQRLLRESPWLMADPASAPDILGLLREAACVPAYVLRLAPDTQRDYDRLARVIRALDLFVPSVP